MRCPDVHARRSFSPGKPLLQAIAATLAEAVWTYSFASSRTVSSYSDALQRQIEVMVRTVVMDDGALSLATDAHTVRRHDGHRWVGREPEPLAGINAYQGSAR